MDRSLRLHQAGVFDPASNNAMNFYTSRYAATFNHELPAHQIPAPDKAPLCPSGYSTAMKKTDLTPAQYDATSLTSRGYGEDLSSTYDEYFQKPDRKTLREKGRQLASLNIKAQRERNGEMVERTGFARNNEYKGKETVADSSTNYNDDYQIKANPHADYRSRSSVLLHRKASNGFTANNANDPLYRLSPGEEDDWMSTTYNLNNANTLNSRVLTNPATAAGYPKDKEFSSFTRLHMDNDSLLGRGYQERPEQPTELKQASRKLNQIKHEDPIDYKYSVAGRRPYVTTYTLSHSTEAREARLHGEKQLQASMNNLPVKVAPTDYGSGDGYTGMYVPQTKRDNEWLSRTIPAPGTFRQSIARAQNSGFTQNFQPYAPGGVAVAMVDGTNISTEIGNHVLSSQVYGDNRPPPGPLPREEEVTRSELMNGAYARNHPPRSRTPQTPLLHPTVNMLHELKKVRKMKNIGEGIRRISYRNGQEIVHGGHAVAGY